MRKNKSIYLLLAYVCLCLQSCLFQEDSKFDEPSATRAAEEVAKYKELLTSVPNGWILEYYPGSNYSMGGITLLCKFDGKNVTIMSEVGSNKTKPGTEVTSVYKVISEQSTLLTFDSFNEMIHCFAEPVLMQNTNFEGDYEFLFMDYDNNQITLQGKKYYNTMTMTPVPDNTDWKNYISQLNKISEEAFLNTYILKVDGKNEGYVVRDSHVFSISTNNEDIEVPFAYTTNGLHLREPLNINGKIIQNFLWNQSKLTFTCTDAGAENVVLEGYYPKGYISYEDYLGIYYLFYKEYSRYNPDTDKVEFIDKFTSVQLKQKIAGKSYIMTGSDLSSDAAEFIVTYDKPTGRIIIEPQRLNIQGYDGSLVMGYDQGYLPSFYGLEFGYIASFAGLNSGLISTVTKTAPMTISFSEYGNLFSTMTGKSATSIVFTVYKSPEFTEKNFLGIWTWFDALELERMN